MSINKDNGGGERERLIKQMEETFREVTWSYDIALNLTKRMISLVEQDVKDNTPDNYEEIVKQMDALERWYDYLGEAIDVASAFRLEHDLDATCLKQTAVDVEDRRMAMRRLRVDLLRWFKDVEFDRPKPTKEELEEARREEDEAWDTGGASLIRREKQQEQE